MAMSEIEIGALRIDQGIEQSRALICENAELILAMAKAMDDPKEIDRLVGVIGTDGFYAVVKTCLLFASQTVFRDKHQALAEAKGVI